MNNIILLKKEDTLNHMGECIKTGHLGCELLDMTRWAARHCQELKNQLAKSGPYYWLTCVKAVNFYTVSTP
jgi:hypothetical protein